MALTTYVEAQDVEERDLVNLSEFVEDGDLHTQPEDDEFSMVTGEPEDVDRWHVAIHTNHGSVIFARETLLPYGGQRDSVEP